MSRPLAAGLVGPNTPDIASAVSAGRARRASGMTRKGALLLGLVLALGSTSRAWAQDAYALLASPSFDSIRQGVQELGRSDDPRALPIISALQDGELFVGADHSLFIRTPS